MIVGVYCKRFKMARVPQQPPNYTPSPRFCPQCNGYCGKFPDYYWNSIPVFELIKFCQNCRSQTIITVNWAQEGF